MANPGFVTGSDRSWWRIRGLLPVQAGVGGEFGVCYRFRLELVSNPGFSGVFGDFRVGVGGDFRIFRDRVADLATGAAIIS
ncbi:hypothetical protein HMPREF0580_0278 [Mobiluncus mulieris ATCC 35239]|uniref:Uncharacterized protein n=1 Tax=Mobiluncus mulieris ATCC 35239 TaxID=871571 RepID=E0QN14_9ACTO|nr:hypothetical protein HMPREF0580_0278 [Mobiluncus mulieris ATCC 35239]